MSECHSVCLWSMGTLKIRKRQRHVRVSLEGRIHEGYLTEFQLVDGRKIVKRFESEDAAIRELRIRSEP